MITIPLQLPDELAQQVLPLQDRLPEIIELGLRQLLGRTERRSVASQPATKQRVLAALDSTGIVTLPRFTARQAAWTRRTPIYAGGPPASEMIIAERRQGYEPT
ncbi:MAG: hypothetical protein FJ011_27335 [Chloroflexi bacterium]|nr:hypothetical protein [Chloroflexota bacterium]